MGVTFSYAVREELPKIIDIYNQAVPTRISTADTSPVTVESKIIWFESYNQTTRPIWVMKIENNIVGWVALEDFYGRPAFKSTAEISLYIDENYQGQGLGQQALDWVFSQLENCGVTTIMAYVFHHNEASQKLFFKNGFERWAHLPSIANMDDELYSLDILGRIFSH